METTINQRIGMIVEYSGLSLNKFASKIGIAQPSLRDCVKGSSEPKFSTIEKIIIAEPIISVDWLIRGEGNMLISSSPVKEEKEGIPLYRSEAAAGFGTAEFAIEEKDIEARYYIKELSTASFMLHVKGDSMMPTYKSGDIIAVRTISDRRQIQWGKPHLIAVVNNGLMVKRIYQDGDNIIATSDNSAFCPVVYHKSEISGIAVVIGSVRIDQY